jgi:catechol 2,3-dioxygenase-like lactoylglutathione lyase family enzyme
MHIKGFSWVGYRTEDIDAATRFFGEVLGLPVLRRSDKSKVIAFSFPSGQTLEVCWPGSRYYALQAQPVLALDVEDITAARAELEAAGIEFLTEISTLPGGQAPGFAWCYFRGPDGHVFQLSQHPD